MTDLFIISHGWNNDPKEAHALYQELFTNVKAQEQNVGTTGRTFAVAGVIWPSKKFDVADDKPNAASLGNGVSRLRNQVETLAAFLAEGSSGAKHKKELDRAKKLIAQAREERRRSTRVQRDHRGAAAELRRRRGRLASRTSGSPAP